MHSRSEGRLPAEIGRAPQRCARKGCLTPDSPRFQDLFARRPAILAPMEDVTDAVFRKLCRGVGAELAMTEFVNVEGLLRGCRNARRKATLTPDDQPTAIQIYGSDPDRLVEAARVAEEARPLFI